MGCLDHQGEVALGLEMLRWQAWAIPTSGTEEPESGGEDCGGECQELGSAQGLFGLKK